MKRVIPYIVGILILIISFFGTRYICDKYYPTSNKNVNISDSVKDAYLSTCRIKVKGPMGGEFTSTGVVLNTGYIFTAGHCVDVNVNTHIEKNEKTQTVEFFGSVASIQTGTFVYYGHYDNFDVAVISVPDPPKSNVKLADSKFGDKLFTIGMTKGNDSNISFGLASSYAHGHARCSISVWQGNSGGGIWTEDQGLTGIVSRMSMAAVPSRVLIPTYRGNNLVFLEGQINSLSPLANWCWYTSAEEIRTKLDNEHLSLLYEVPHEEFYIDSAYIHMAIQILGVLFCVWFFRKYILG